MDLTHLPWLRRGGLVVAAGLSAIAIGACGGSEGSSQAASGGGTSSSSSNDRDTARLRLQECLRDQGIDLPEPGQGGGRPQMSAADREKIQEAFEGPCKELQQGAFGNISEEDRQEFQDAFQEFASCMRDQGIDLPDIRPGQGGAPPGGRGGIDMDDPDVRAAQQKCRDKLPQGGPGGGPGGGQQ